MHDKCIVETIGVLVVTDVQQSVRTGLVLRNPPKQIQHSVITVVAASADEQMRLSVQVARDVDKQKLGAAKSLPAVLERRDEIVSARLKNGHVRFVRIVSDDVESTVELVRVNRR